MLGADRCMHPGSQHSVMPLWMDGMLHHVETVGSHCSLVFAEESHHSRVSERWCEMDFAHPQKKTCTFEAFVHVCPLGQLESWPTHAIIVSVQLARGESRSTRTMGLSQHRGPPKRGGFPYVFLLVSPFHLQKRSLKERHAPVCGRHSVRVSTSPSARTSCAEPSESLTRTDAAESLPDSQARAMPLP